MFPKWFIKLYIYINESEMVQKITKVDGSRVTFDTTSIKMKLLRNKGKYEIVSERERIVWNIRWWLLPDMYIRALLPWILPSYKRVCMYSAKMPWDYIEEKKYSANLCLKDVWPRCLETILTILKEEKYSAMMPWNYIKEKICGKIMPRTYSRNVYYC